MLAGVISFFSIAVISVFIFYSLSDHRFDLKMRLSLCPQTTFSLVWPTWLCCGFPPVLCQQMPSTTAVVIQVVMVLLHVPATLPPSLLRETGHVCIKTTFLIGFSLPPSSSSSPPDYSTLSLFPFFSLPVLVTFMACLSKRKIIEQASHLCLLCSSVQCA